MLRDFKTFIAKGNGLDLAVAVIIGAAFAKIVTSLTDDIIMVIAAGNKPLSSASPGSAYRHLPVSAEPEFQAFLKNGRMRS